MATQLFSFSKNKNIIHHCRSYRMETQQIVSSSNSLSLKSCKACSGQVPAVPQNEIPNYFQQLNDDWKLNDKHHLEREYRFKNFKLAMDFANQIAVIAEQEKHHPDLHISWGKCIVEIFTHKISALTENDFILAAKIDSFNSQK